MSLRHSIFLSIQVWWIARQLTKILDPGTAQEYYTAIVIKCTWGLIRFYQLFIPWSYSIESGATYSLYVLLDQVAEMVRA